jgi:kynureninase
MVYLTREAHERGIAIGFDCCHSVGAIRHEFDKWGVDFAMWCSYKYLNCGPGSTAFLYVNRKHFDKGPSLPGWFGNRKETQFDMRHDFEPAGSAGAWQISSPSIFSAAATRSALEVIHEAGIDNIRKRSLDMTSYLIYLIDELISKSPYNFSVGTPREPARRGGHVAIEHPAEAARINDALIARSVVTDFRKPNIIRIAPVALYNTYSEIWQVVRHLKEIIDNKEYERFPKFAD